MKNFCISLICLSIIVLTVILGTEGLTPKHEEYLRIHVRANSNTDEDQCIKYAVKDAVVEYLTPIVAECKSKDDLQKSLKSHVNALKSVVNTTLQSAGFNYGGEVEVKEEAFPTRVYEELTLEAGYYDALIISLGKAEGDNWWCVVYPPLCFTGEGRVDFKYRSKIAEIISSWREKNG